MPSVVTRMLSGAAALVVAQSLISSARAAMIVDESFLTGATPSAGEYTSGATLGTQSPTVAGFTGTWLQSTGGGTVQAASLSTSYSSTEFDTPTGGSLVIAAAGHRVSRLFDSSVTSLMGTGSTGTVYLSFLAQFGGQGGFNYAALELGGDGSDGTRALDGSDGTRALGVGIVGATGIGFKVNSNASVFMPSPTVAANQTYTFLVKINFSSTAASDSLTMWVNPALGGVGDPMGGVAATGLNLRAVNRLQIASFNGSNSIFDEVRIGTSLQDVTAVPEPSSAALLAGSACIGLALARRRRRA
jgi:hypothetical protein